MFKGTKVKLMIDIFNPELIRIEYRKKVFNTYKIPDRMTAAEKRRLTIIQNKKDLEAALAKRDFELQKGNISKKP